MIAWSEILAEKEAIDLGFRELIVALFRKYEGQETDEKVRGKVVLVTAASFARHAGIPKASFYEWVEKSESGIRNPKPDEPAPSCMNEGVPPAEGFVREVTARIVGMLPLLRHLSDETHQMIAEDIGPLRAAIDTLETNLKVRNK